ncbi:MAG: exosortase/archaeosortase family protein [Ruminococcus sp.]|nr:exosortase/archaeosortase family protein [Ruminococcus sp.]
MALIEKKTIVKNEIDYDKLAEIILMSRQTEINYDKLATALLDAVEKKKEERERLEREQVLQHKEEILHQLGAGKDDLTGNVILDFVKQFKMVLKIKREHQYNNNIITELKKTLSQMFFRFMEFAFIFVGFAIIMMSAFYSSIGERIAYSFSGFGIVFLSNIFRIACYEAEEMQSDTKINNTYDSILTFISTIAAIAAAVFAFKSI